jgi:hypothetical protein
VGELRGRFFWVEDARDREGEMEIVGFFWK